MDRPEVQPVPVERAQRRAAAARASASRAAGIAERIERRAATAAPELGALLLSIAARHRESEWRFRAVATLHHRHAERLRLAQAHAAGHLAFIAAIADCLDQPSTALTLLGRQRDILTTAASDATARAAQNLEFTLGEGPVHDVTAADSRTHPAVVPITGSEIAARWPLYGPGLGTLGVRSLVAAPLRLAGAGIGALVAFSSSPTVPASAVTRIHDLAAGLTEEPPNSADAPTTIDSLGFAAVLEEDDIHTATHQAAGMVSVQLGIGIDAAYAVLKARAFADDVDLHDLAARVVRSDVRLL